jgi:rhodanese-related sulfurtransferase
MLCLAGFVVVMISNIQTKRSSKSGSADKVRGAIAMSVYADALGLPFEFKQDLSANPDSMTSLDLSPDQIKNLGFEDPWAVWTPANKKQKAYYSDDSFFKLDLLPRYLNWLSASNQIHSDLRFAKFISQDLTEISRAKTKKPAYASAKKCHYEGWHTMMREMLCAEKPKICSEAKQLGAHIDGRSFYSPKTSICFGMFMYSLAGIWDAGVGAGFTTDLDTEDGKIISAYFQQLLAYAVQNGCSTQTPKKTEEMYFRSLSETSQQLPQKMVNMRKKAIAWGQKHKDKPIKELWTSLQQERAQNLPGWVKPLGFDPAEFAFVFWAALGLSDSSEKNQTKRALKPLLVIANAGGDTDTIASLYGSFIGAHYGLRFFKNGLKKPLQKLRQQIKEDGLDTEKLVVALQKYSSKSKGYTRMRQAALAQHLKTNSKGIEVDSLPARALLVDVRSSSEMQVSMIEGAITEEQFKSLSDAEQKAQPVIFYCTIGYRSGLAAKRYAKQGIQAQNLIGGVSAWAFAGRPFIAQKSHTKKVHTYNKDWNYLPETHSPAGKPIF